MIPPTGDSCEDDATASLVLQLQLEDLEELSKSSKGKQREDAPVDDFALATSLYKAELDLTASTILDRNLSWSIARAVRDDGELIDDWKEQEYQAARDRKVALHLAKSVDSTSRDNIDVSGPTEAESYTADSELLDKLSALYLFGLNNESDEIEGIQPESSSWATGRGTSITKRRECAVCFKKFRFHDVARAPCADGHEYCRGCLRELFSRCLTDESLFPPRCCGEPFLLDSVRVFLTSSLVGEFLARSLELETPDRTYCHRPSCSTFIPPQFIRQGEGMCPRCQARTCIICKGAPHTGDCPRDTGLQEVLRVAEENEWQRCYSCQRVVELVTGCNHMSKSASPSRRSSASHKMYILLTLPACRCGAQFCYVCGAEWKTCNCPQFHEERLLERAAEVVDRDIGQRVVPARERDLMVEQAQENLRDNHQCQHRSWRSIGGPRRCEECHNTLPLYLNVCRQCQIMVCRRCRLNRL